jgi:ligand-binding SRPBCC domain-containing protein
LETIIVETSIRAPLQRCFDAARDLDLHVKSLAHTNEVAVAGRTSGLIGFGEEVTWRGRHFGITQHFTSKITAFSPPLYFQDSMQRGAFKSFVHDHYFSEADGVTSMKDVLAFSAPFGPLGRIAEKLVLKRYLARMLTARANVIRDAAEAAHSALEDVRPGD